MRESHVRFIRQLGYPVPIVDNGWYGAAMFQPRVIASVVALGAVLRNPWLFLGLSIVLWWSTIMPADNPFDAIYNRFVQHPRGLPLLPPAPAPRRFAQAMAGTVAFVIAVALFERAMMIVWIGLAPLAAALFAVIVRDNCAAGDVFKSLSGALRRTTRAA